MRRAAPKWKYLDEQSSLSATRPLLHAQSIDDLDREVQDAIGLARGATAPKTARGRATRQRIVVAASELIAERGVAETSLDDVIERAGASKSQLYHYFEDRAALLRAVVVHNAEAVVATCRRSTAGGRSDRGRRAARAPGRASRRRGCPIGPLVDQLAEERRAGTACPRAGVRPVGGSPARRPALDAAGRQARPGRRRRSARDGHAVRLSRRGARSAHRNPDATPAVCDCPRPAAYAHLRADAASPRPPPRNARPHLAGYSASTTISRSDQCDPGDMHDISPTRTETHKTRGGMFPEHRGRSDHSRLRRWPAVAARRSVTRDHWSSCRPGGSIIESPSPPRHRRHRCIKKSSPMDGWRGEQAWFRWGKCFPPNALVFIVAPPVPMPRWG